MNFENEKKTSETTENFVTKKIKRRPKTIEEKLENAKNAVEKLEREQEENRKKKAISFFTNNKIIEILNDDNKDILEKFEKEIKEIVEKIIKELKK
jgi:hypothetical protein